MRKIYLFYLIFMTKSIYAQNVSQTKDEEQLWLGYFNQTRLTDKWGIWADLHFRAKDEFIQEPSKALLRIGGTYYINDDLKLTNGYTYVNHYPDDGHANISQPEHRIWQQVQFHTKLKKIKYMNWLRLEERFKHKIKNDNELADGYNFDLRLRSNFMFSFPLSKKGIIPKTFSAILNDEIFINIHSSNQNNYFPFDQNRFFAGIAYNISSYSNLQLGYMNVYQQLSPNTKFLNINAIRLFYFQNIDLRKKKTS